MMKADQVILLDTDTWSRKGRTHRALIRGEEDTQWINIPIRTADKKKPINEVRIDPSDPWFEAFWNAILHNYSNSMYFDHLQDELYANLEEASKAAKLIDFDLTVFRTLIQLMEIDLPFDLASETNFCVDEHRIVYQEYSSKNYIRQMERADQALTRHPEYRQTQPGFEPGCSCLDLLLNYGGESFKVLELLR